MKEVVKESDIPNGLFMVGFNVNNASTAYYVSYILGLKVLAGQYIGDSYTAASYQLAVTNKKNFLANAKFAGAGGSTTVTITLTMIYMEE